MVDESEVDRMLKYFLNSQPNRELHLDLDVYVVLTNRLISTAFVHASCQSAGFFLRRVGVNRSNPVSAHRCGSETVPGVTCVFSVE